MPARRTRSRSGKSAIFLDRDGVINVSPGEGHITHWDQFQFLPGALQALRLLKQKRILTIVVSNQSAVGRGFMTASRLKEITERMLQQVRKTKGAIQAVYYCTHRPNANCSCRKPRIGSLKKAARRFGIDLGRSFVVGDTESDIRMGEKAGCRTVLVLSGKVHSRAEAKRLSTQPEKIARHLQEAVRWMIQQPEFKK